MNVFRRGVGQNWIGAVRCLVAGIVLSASVSQASGQTTNAVSVNLPPNATPELTEFLQNRATLAAAIAQVNTSDPQALAQFQQANATLLNRQKQLAPIIAQQQAQNNPIPTPPPLQMPPNASPQMQAYLTAWDQLARSRIAFKNQNVTDDPATLQTAEQQWRQQNAALIQQVQQLAQPVAQQVAQTPLPTPPPLQMPPNASPQMQSFLTVQDQLIRSQTAFNNQHLTDDPATRQVAEQQWRQQNASLIQQYHQLAQALPNSN